MPVTAMARRCKFSNESGLFRTSPVTLHLHVDNVDATVERAVKAGAKITMPVADMFWGDRYGQLVDPFGHHWSVATHVRDVSMEEMQQAMQKGSA